MNHEFIYEITQIITEASKIYGKIKDVILNMDDGREYTPQDKKCLSLLLGILENDNDGCHLLNDFNITYQKIIDGLSLKIEESQEEKDYTKEMEELVLLLSDKETRYYTRKIKSIDLVSQLLLPLECGSSFFEDITVKLNLEKYDDLIDSKLGAIIDKKLEVEEENHFEDLNEQEKKRKTIKPELGFTKKKRVVIAGHNGILEELGANPYNVDLSYGRDDEIRKLMVSLLIPNKSAILIGEAGVGKTALVQGLAHRIAKGNVPDVFLNKKIYSLNVAALVSGCKYVGMFEERLTKLLEELAEDDDILLFIDEIHSIIGAGKGVNSSNDMANILKPYLDSRAIKVIGATTTEEYEKYIKPNTALKRRFEVIKVKEPDNETLKEICLKVIDKLCLEMDMFFLSDVYTEDEVIDNLVKLTDSRHRHYQDKVNNPDLIVSLLTRSFALAKFYNKKIVEISDLIEAICDNERIYEISKQRIINSLRGLSETKEKSEFETRTAKIIEFPGKH